jgi:phage/plasmid-associated DNA primase
MSKKNKQKKKSLLDYLNTDCFGSNDNEKAMPWDAYQISTESCEDDFQSISEDDRFESRTTENIPDDSERVSDEDFMRLTDMFQKRTSEKTVDKEKNWSDIPFDSDDDLFDLVEEKMVEKETSSKQNNAAPSKLFQKKKEGKKSTLHLMEQALLDKVTLISHDDGLYYFNGRCYVAIRDSTELLRLIRDKVSETAFEVASLKPCNDLHPFLKSSSNLIPNNYEEKLQKAKKLIALKNGVLNMNELDLKKFDAKYLLFHSIDASWTNEYPTKFMKFIRQSCQYDEEVVELTLEMIGYLLSGSNRGKGSL